jgi:hypothetical protein
LAGDIEETADVFLEIGACPHPFANATGNRVSAVGIVERSRGFPKKNRCFIKKLNGGS